MYKKLLFIVLFINFIFAETTEVDNLSQWIVENQGEFQEIIRDSISTGETEWLDNNQEAKEPTKKQIKKQEKIYKTQKLEQKKIQKEIERERKIKGGFYTVQIGDTLYSISREFGISKQKLMEINGIKDVKELSVGQKIKVIEKQETKKDNSKVVSYTVKANDSLFSIANKFGVSVKSVKEFNNIEDVTSLSIGQVIKIPPKSKAKKQETAGEILDNMNFNIPDYKYYKVQQGDTLRIIAKKHNMTVKKLKEYNKGLKGTELWIGRILKVDANYKKQKLITKNEKITDKDISGTQEAKDDKNRFNWPIVGRILKSYGPQATGLTNEGINIAAKMNKFVKASDDGVVVYVGDELSNYGNLILIQHDTKWISAYAHLSKAIVIKGQKVKKGDSIGRIGATGDVKKPQLHFELRYNTRTVDPLVYLNSNR